MNKEKFYLLSFTWGLPLTLIGLVVAAALLIRGKKPKKWGWCYYFEVGKGWGGLELGFIFLTGENSTEHTKNHEHGHGLQNCIYGLLMPFIVCIPSAVRYWYRKYRKSIGKPCTTAYDDIWFEGQATEWGTKIVDEINASV